MEKTSFQPLKASNESVSDNTNTFNFHPLINPKGLGMSPTLAADAVAREVRIAARSSENFLCPSTSLISGIASPIASARDATPAARAISALTSILGYAGRYARRPPIAQHRFRHIDRHEIRFVTKDTRTKRRVMTRYTAADFLTTLAATCPTATSTTSATSDCWPRAPRPTRTTPCSPCWDRHGEASRGV